MLLTLVQGVNRLLWAGLGSAGPLQSPTPASQSGAGRRAGHTCHCAADTCMCQLVHVSHVCCSFNICDVLRHTSVPVTVMLPRALLPCDGDRGSDDMQMHVSEAV